MRVLGSLLRRIVTSYKLVQSYPRRDTNRCVCVWDLFLCEVVFMPCHWSGLLELSCGTRGAVASCHVERVW